MKPVLKTVLSLFFIFSLSFSLVSCGFKVKESPDDSNSGKSETIESFEESTSELSETTAEVLTSSPVEIAEKLYESTIKNYPNFHAERLNDWGYTQNGPIDYAYAIKDLNGDGILELILFDYVDEYDENGLYIKGKTEDFGALYTLDGSTPVFLEGLVRHGYFWINSDGYIIYDYKWMNIAKISGNELVDVVVPEKMWADFEGDYDKWNSYKNNFLKENGISDKPMEFDYTYLTGSAD